MEDYYYRNISNTYKKISERSYINILDEECQENVREVVVVNEKHKQSIIFHEHRFDGEKLLDDVCYIPNYISESAYKYICHVLNKHNNVTVIWSQAYGTTSDYTIIYDNYFTNIKQCEEYIENLKSNKSVLEYKYAEILKDGTCMKCDEKEIIK